MYSSNLGYKNRVLLGIPPKYGMPRRKQAIAQGIYWSGTIWFPHPLFPCNTLPDGVVWIRGQLEESATGRKHYQIVFALSERGRLRACSRIFGKDQHYELTRSEAINEYVWKDASSLGERFELGIKPLKVNSKTDWEAVWECAKSGNLSAIPPRIRVLSYRTIRAISSDFSTPVGMEREVSVFWGPTGTGKSRRAWNEAGSSGYSKCPRTKFWDGYQDQESVVIDEFRGGIDVSHLLRWFDRYPVRVEIKGSTRPLHARRIYITSNLEPTEWYPELDGQSYLALMRRLTLVEKLE